MSDHVAPPSSAARTAWWRATRAASNDVEAPPTTLSRWVLSGDVTVRVVVGSDGREMAKETPPERRLAPTRRGVRSRVLSSSRLSQVRFLPKLVKLIT